MKAQLETLADEVRADVIDPKVGAVVNQILNTRVRLIETERKLRETEELARDLAELTSAFERQQEMRRHGT